jgi:transposase
MMNKKISLQDWTSEEKIQVVIACDSLDENAIISFCRNEGIEPLHVKQWQNNFRGCIKANSNTAINSGMKTLKQENKFLKKEIKLKDKLLAERIGLLARQKKSLPDLNQRRGRLTMTDERNKLADLVNEARKNGARQSEACDIIGISKRTLQRWELPKNKNDGRLDSTHIPKNKLSRAERQLILKVVNDAEHVNMTPCKIVTKLASEGRFIGSASSFYRILKAEKLSTHPELSKSKPKTKVT